MTYSTSIGEAQVTNYDRDESLFVSWTAMLPHAIATPLAYMAAVKLVDALMALIEGFEKSQAFKRITGAQ